MAYAEMRITFESDSGEPSVFQRRLEFKDLREPGGKEFTAQYMLSVAAMESNWNSYRLALPGVPNFARETEQTFRLEDLVSSVYEDRRNTQAVWVEITHILLRVRVLLAKSRAYHDQELEQSSDQHSEKKNLQWHLHLDRMEHFDLAVILLGKVNELAARLVFERLGASLIRNLDRRKPDWEREVTWKNIRIGLADKAGNPHLAAIPLPEYDAIQEIFDDFLKTETGTRLWAYRIKVVHRITPSVDRPDLYTRLEDRELTPLVDGAGRIEGWTKSIRLKRAAAEYVFPDLYDDAVRTLRHYIAVLERLEAIPRFGPEAEASED